MKNEYGYWLVWLVFVGFVVLYGHQMSRIWDDKKVYGDYSAKESSVIGKVLYRHVLYRNI